MSWLRRELWNSSASGRQRLSDSGRKNTIVGSDVTNSLLLMPSEERVTLLIYDGIKFLKN